MSPNDDLAMLQRMLLIRSFERALQARRDHGFQLLSTGQEAVAVGVAAALGPHDQMLTSGRSIGAALANGLPPAAVMAELLGRVTGPCLGRGGRGHISQPRSGFFGAHSVVGGNLAVAAGVALALKSEGKGGIAVCQFGDGACGSGALHETMNVAALWRLPLLLVCDNNGYSVSTPSRAGLAPRRRYGCARRAPRGGEIRRACARRKRAGIRGIPVPTFHAPFNIHARDALGGRTCRRPGTRSDFAPGVGVGRRRPAVA
jgi:TPP-dependent pyruvate/acetoin dehydrogenase alpha subunit